MLERFMAIVGLTVTLLTGTPVLVPQEVVPMLPMQQEGNPGHKEPPPGWICEPPDAPRVTPDHACDCHRECYHSEDGVRRMLEDPVCKVYCYMDHCACPIEGCETDS